MNDFKLEANIEWFTVPLAVKWAIPTSSGNCMNERDSKSSFESLLLARQKLSEDKLFNFLKPFFWKKVKIKANVKQQTPSASSSSTYPRLLFQRKGYYTALVFRSIHAK